MSKYIILENLTLSNQYKEGSDEELACEIASRILLISSAACNFHAIEATSKQATFEVLKNNALCSLEINNANKKIWNSEISKIYQKEKEMQDCIQNAWWSLRDLEQIIIKMGKSSKYCSKLQMHESFSLDFHFLSIDDTAHVDLSEDLKRIYSFKLITH